jgi:uncharacterized membrane protein YqjE
MAGASPPGAPGSRSADALVRLLQSLLAVVETRGRLLSTELEEERAWLELRVIFAVVAALAGGFALLLFTLLAVVAFWDTHRLEALATAGLVYAAIAAWAGLRVARIGAEKPALLGSTLAELARDREALRSGTLARRVAEAEGDEGAA